MKEWKKPKSNWSHAAMVKMKRLKSENQKEVVVKLTSSPQGPNNHNYDN
jgi:hypothetical protein